MQEVVFATNTLDGGGVERVFVNLINVLTLNGMKAKLILCKKQGIFVNQVNKDVEIVDLNCRLRSSFFPFYKALKNIKRGTHVICAPQFVCFMLILINFFRKEKLKIIVTHHSLDDRDVKELGMIGRFEKKMIRWLYKHAHIVIAVSNSVRNYLVDELKVPSSKVKVIYNPTLSPAIRDLAHEEMDDHFMNSSLQQPIPVITAVGRLGKVKRLDILLLSFADLIKEIPAKLVLVGDGPEREQLEETIRELKLEGHVHITGFKGNPYPYIFHSSVFVSSSESESFSIVILEALYLGTSVVATRTSGALEILNNGQFGKMANCLDPGDLKRALKEALLDTNKQANADMENWTQQFQITNIARQYLEVLRNN